MAGYTGHRWTSSLEPILAALRAVGAAPLLAPPPSTPTPHLDRLIAYEHDLTGERGLTLTTVRFYLRVARAVLPDDGDLSQLTAALVTGQIRRLAQHYSVGTTKYWVAAMRALLRYLFVQGELAVDLTGAIPAVAGWRLTGLPRDLDPALVAQLVRTCDARTHAGRRARAAVLLMVRLGLRVGEVAALAEWRSGDAERGSRFRRRGDTGTTQSS